MKYFSFARLKASVTLSIQKFKVNTMLNAFEKWCVIFAVQKTNDHAVHQGSVSLPKIASPAIIYAESVVVISPFFVCVIIIISLFQEDTL